jgi:hypothetical protein
MKKIILMTILGFSLCRTLNDAKEQDEIKKCRNALLYNLYLSQELARESSGKINEQALMFSYTQCLEVAKLKRGKVEIPL